jgi:chromosome segregation ATPase
LLASQRSRAGGAHAAGDVAGRPAEGDADRRAHGQLEQSEFAALAANIVARVYEQRNLERRLSYSADASGWLGDEYQQLLRELREAEQALVDFKSTNNVVATSLQDDQNEISSRRKKLAEQLNGVDVQLITLRAEREQLASATGDMISERTPSFGRTRSPRNSKKFTWRSTASWWPSRASTWRNTRPWSAGRAPQTHQA